MAPDDSTHPDTEQAVFEAGAARRVNSDAEWLWPMNKGHRACLECRRKKTKCDMRQPVCGLCCRTGSSCTFPTKRKTPEFRGTSNMRDGKKRRIDPERLERLVDLLESKLNDGQSLDQLSPPTSETRLSTGQPDDTSPELPVSLDLTSGCADQNTTADADSIIAYTAGSPDSSLNYACHSETSERPVDTSCVLDVPEEIATELIHLFFDKIQPWLPLLHKPRFLARYMTKPGSEFCYQNSYSTQEAFLLYGIFALAARYSNSPCFQDIQPPDRGVQFEARANQYYKTLRATETKATLLFLQGCILLASYLCASGPSHQSWVLTGVCVRFAYDLDLCNVDDNDIPWESSAQWADLEERRRAFWLVWELDAFGSIMSRRPNAIDRHRMAVRLPVKDAAWFANEPVQSPVLHPRPSEAWKVLLDSPNQDERAWFLLANYLMAVCNDIQSSRHASAHDRDELADSVTCLTLAILQRFGVEKHPVIFDSENFVRSNWIIGMHLMLITARTSVLTAGTTRTAGTFTSAHSMSRVIFHWHPDYIDSSHPFLACTLLPTHIQRSKELPQPPNGGSQPHQDMLILILTRYASIWKLGSLLLDVAAILTCRTELSDEDTRLAKYFAVYFPQPNSSVSITTTTKEAQTQAQPLALSDEVIMADHPLGNAGSSEQLFGFSGLSVDFQGAEDVSTEAMTSVSIEEAPLGLIPVSYDDWTSALQLDSLCDDNQHFNYLAL